MGIQWWICAYLLPLNTLDMVGSTSLLHEMALPRQRIDCMDIYWLASVLNDMFSC